MMFNHVLTTKYTDYIKNSVEFSIFLADSSPEEIKEIIKELSSNKASDIPIIILKHCSHMMSPILAKFVNSFSNLGLFPSILKTGIVSPVLKKTILNYLKIIDQSQHFQFLVNYSKNYIQANLCIFNS